MIEFYWGKVASLFFPQDSSIFKKEIGLNISKYDVNGAVCLQLEITTWPWNIWRNHSTYRLKGYPLLIAQRLLQLAWSLALASEKDACRTKPYHFSNGLNSMVPSQLTVSAEYQPFLQARNKKIHHQNRLVLTSLQIAGGRSWVLPSLNTSDGIASYISRARKRYERHPALLPQQGMDAPPCWSKGLIPPCHRDKLYVLSIKAISDLNSSGLVFRQRLKALRFASWQGFKIRRCSGSLAFRIQRNYYDAMTSPEHRRHSYNRLGLQSVRWLEDFFDMSTVLAPGMSWKSLDCLKSGKAGRGKGCSIIRSERLHWYPTVGENSSYVKSRRGSIIRWAES